MTRDQYDKLRRTLRNRVERADYNRSEPDPDGFYQHTYEYVWDAWNRRQTELFQHFCDHRTGPW